MLAHLRELGVDIDQDDRSRVMYAKGFTAFAAILAGKVEKVRFLLERGADVEGKNVSALEWAERRQDLKMVELVRDHTSTALRDTKFRHSYIHHLVYRDRISTYQSIF